MSNISKFNKIEHKIISFDIKECKQIEREGQPIGTFAGYASTFDIDRGRDRIARGAFAKTLKDLKERNRPIRMLFQHSMDDPIGGFPISEAFEDDKGLFVKGEIVLNVQRGAETYALIKSGFLSDMSIGFMINDFDMVKDQTSGDMIRLIKELELFEISVVSEPMNQNANILSVKTVVPFQDLPLADRDREWDSDAAVGRIRELTGSMDEPSDSYRNAFFWFDNDAPDNFGSYKLPYADVIDGRLVAVPRGIFAVAGVLQGARGGTDIPEADQERIKRNVERYYDKMGLESPFREERSYFVNIESAKNIGNKKEFEKALRESGAFSRDASNYLASCFEPKQSESVTEAEQTLKEALSEFKTMLNTHLGEC